MDSHLRAHPHHVRATSSQSPDLSTNSPPKTDFQELFLSFFILTKSSLAIVYNFTLFHTPPTFRVYRLLPHFEYMGSLDSRNNFLRSIQLFINAFKNRFFRVLPSPLESFGVLFSPKTLHKAKFCKNSEKCRYESGGIIIPLNSFILVRLQKYRTVLDFEILKDAR